MQTLTIGSEHRRISLFIVMDTQSTIAISFLFHFGLTIKKQGQKGNKVIFFLSKGLENIKVFPLSILCLETCQGVL